LLGQRESRVGFSRKFADVRALATPSVLRDEDHLQSLSQNSLVIGGDKQGFQSVEVICPGLHAGCRYRRSTRNVTVFDNGRIHLMTNRLRPEAQLPDLLTRS
jgi:hypothetical protein